MKLFYFKLKISAKINNCRIHPARPAACRDWAPGLDRPECRAGLREIWQLSVSDSGQVSGSKIHLDEYRSFLKSLANLPAGENGR